MKPFTNDQLESLYKSLRVEDDEWPGLDWLVLKSIQNNKVHPELLALFNEDESRQLIWYWLGKQCQYHTLKAYKGRDTTNRKLNYYKPWHTCDDKSSELLQTRILELYNFVASYTRWDGKKNSKPEQPEIAIYAWKRRFHELELIRQIYERSGVAGIKSNSGLAQRIALITRFLPPNDDIDVAVDRYIAHLEERHAQWRNHRSRFKKEPSLPTDANIAKFAQDCIHYVRHIKPRLENVGTLNDETTTESQYSSCDTVAHEVLDYRFGDV